MSTPRDRNVIIYGCSRGIGRALAIEYAALGLRADRLRAGGEPRVVDEHGADTHHDGVGSRANAMGDLEAHCVGEIPCLVGLE